MAKKEVWFDHDSKEIRSKKNKAIKITKKTRVYPIYFGQVNFKIMSKTRSIHIGFSNEVYKNTNESQNLLIKKLERNFCKKGQTVEIKNFENEQELGISLLPG